jgi:hypothetical protein
MQLIDYSSLPNLCFDSQKGYKKFARNLCRNFMFEGEEIIHDEFEYTGPFPLVERWGDSVFAAPLQILPCAILDFEPHLVPLMR